MPCVQCFRFIQTQLWLWFTHLLCWKPGPLLGALFIVLIHHCLQWCHRVIISLSGRRLWASSSTSASGATFSPSLSWPTWSWLQRKCPQLWQKRKTCFAACKLHCKTIQTHFAWKVVSQPTSSIERLFLQIDVDGFHHHSLKPCLLWWEYVHMWCFTTPPSPISATTLVTSKVSIWGLISESPSIIINGISPLSNE